MAMSNAERTARYRAKNRKLCADRTKRWIASNAEKYKKMKRKNNILKNYGINIIEYTQMLNAQGMKCAICRSDNKGSKVDWHVDHCHKTKIVRGILCAHCNKMLSGAKDNPESLASAIRYLIDAEAQAAKDHIDRARAMGRLL